MLFTHFYLTQGQRLETWFVSLASREYFGVEPTTFLSTNWQKRIHWYNELLNMFFHRCSYKNSCFIELVYNSTVVLMICNIKNVLKGIALDFFILRACCQCLHSLSSEICSDWLTLLSARRCHHIAS